MALIRAEVRNRLGDTSIYDCIVESMRDFSTEPMLDRMHVGSIALCLNLDSTNENSGEAQSAPICYIKSSDGSWKQGSVSNASLMNLMESLMAQKMLGMRGGSGGHSPIVPADISAWEGQFTPASDTYQPDPISVPGEWDRMVIWTEDTFLIGRRNISGAVIWKTNSTLAYKIMYTNNTGTAGIVSQLLGGGPLFSAQGNDLCFGTDISFGVYASGTTYKWIAWKEDP